MWNTPQIGRVEENDKIQHPISKLQFLTYPSGNVHISPSKARLKMIFLFPRWDMLYSSLEGTFFLMETSCIYCVKTCVRMDCMDECMCKCACSYLCEYVLYSTSKFLHRQGIAITLITHAHGALLCFIRLSSCRLCNLQNGCILNTRKWTTTLELASTEHLRCWGFAFIAINNTTYPLLSIICNWSRLQK